MSEKKSYKKVTLIYELVFCLLIVNIFININNEKQCLHPIFYREHPYMDYTPSPIFTKNLVSPFYDFSKISNLPLSKGGFHIMH